MRLAVFTVLALVAALQLAPAQAQDATLAKVYACTDIKDNAQRLACYDGAIASFRQAENKGAVAVVTREQIEQVQKDAFGLSVPAVDALAASSISPKAEKPRPLDRVAVEVKDIQQPPHARITFVLSDGQVWRQIDVEKLGRLGKGPWQAEIRKAAIGSFLLKIEGQSAIRVERAQ